MPHQLLAAIDDWPSTPVTLGSAATPAHRDRAAGPVLPAVRMLSDGPGITETDAARPVEGRG